MIVNLLTWLAKYQKYWWHCQSNGLVVAIAFPVCSSISGVTASQMTVILVIPPDKLQDYQQHCQSNSIIANIASQMLVALVALSVK